MTASAATTPRWTAVPSRWRAGPQRRCLRGCQCTPGFPNHDGNRHPKPRFSKCIRASGSGSSVGDASDESIPLPPVDIYASPRWDLVHARSVSVIAEILMTNRDGQKILRKAIRGEWSGFNEMDGWTGDARGGGINNAERSAIAETVLGVEVNRLTLAWLVVERTRSAYPEFLEAAGGVDAFGLQALDEVLFQFGLTHTGSERNEKTEKEKHPSRSVYVSAATSMVSLHWMQTTGVSNEFSRETLSVLRGGAKIFGDLWPEDAAQNISAKHSIPVWFAKRLINDYGEREATALAFSLKQKAPLTIRRNAIICPYAEELIRALEEENVVSKTLDEVDEDIEHLNEDKASSRKNEIEILENVTPPVIGAPDCLRFTNGRPRVGIFGLTTYQAGAFEVQDAGSQCIANAVTQGVSVLIAAGLEKTLKKSSVDSESLDASTDANRVIKILDTCCGNGGKTLAIASKLHTMGIDYRIDVFDVDERRLRHLQSAAKRAGCFDKTRIVSKLDLRAIASVGGSYDAVLVDAPCSSTGAIRRFPSSRWSMSKHETVRMVEENSAVGYEHQSENSCQCEIPSHSRYFDDVDYNQNTNQLVDGDLRDGSDRDSVTNYPHTQLSILKDASTLVKHDNGILIYATCSLLQSENEQVVQAFENRVSVTKFQPFPFPKSWPCREEDESSDCILTEPRHTVGLTPSKHGTDGFFIARWVSKGE